MYARLTGRYCKACKTEGLCFGVPAEPSWDPKGFGYWFNGVPKVELQEWGYIGTLMNNTVRAARSLARPTDSDRAPDRFRPTPHRRARFFMLNSARAVAFVLRRGATKIAFACGKATVGFIPAVAYR